jgi:glycosyltransferase involved in cell wall biosynthesis/ADP-heptose:LPS heptosyltransferase/SAM-dependent methyltransferase
MEADRKGKVMLLGKGHLQGFIEQSLFLCKHDFLLEFVNQYLSFNTGDYPLLPEEKFRKIMEKLPSKIGLMDIGYGRIRPADFSDKVFFIQQPNDSELLELNNRGLIRQNKIKINFGCGSNRLRGWINHDIEVDLTKTLPYNDSEADYIFAEHVVEHLTLHEAYRFFRECFRILKPGGAIRITVPSISNVFHRKSGAYLRFLQAQNWGDGSDASAVESILFNHGHKSAWTDELLKIVLTNIGFKARTAEIYKSDIPDFIDVEGHQRIIGEEFNRIESISVEGSKEPCPFSDHTHRIDDQKFQNSDLRPAETFQGKLLGSDRRVLLVRTDAIGDFVIFSNVLPSFKTLHPEAKISILLQDTVAQLAQNCPYIDEIITFKASRIRDAQYRSEILAQLQSRHFEIAYYPVYSRDEIGDMLTLQSGAAKKVTFSGDCSNMPVQLKSNNDKNYDMLIPSVPGVLLETQRNREFMKGLGVDVPDSQGTCIWSNQKDEDFIVELLKNLNINNPIVISPFARLRIKDWPIEKWAQLLSHYPEESVLICAGPNDYERAQKLIGMSSHRHIYNLCGKTTLSQTAVLMRHCKLYIGVDTGPAHMAVAADVPNVVLMGGGHFGRFMPYSPSTTMVHCKVSCINCNWRCRFRTRTAPCLTQISVETVFRAIDAALCRPVCERKEPLVITDTLPYEPILYRIEDIKSIVEMYLLGLRLLRSNERDDARSVLEQTVKRLSPYMTIGVQWETLGEGEHYFDTVGCYISACTTLAQCYMQAGEFGKIKAVYQHLLQNPVLPFYDEQISELRSIIAKLQKVEPDNSVFAATALGASQKVQNLIPKPSHAAPKYLISAVISTYNSEKYIRGCLEDLENQTIADKLEIIVVNSASEQNEESVVKEFQNRYGNIVYIKTDKREGLYSAWNRAIKVASGQFLTSANTDDRHCKNALEVMASALLTSPDVALVYGDQIVTDTPNPTFENHHVIEAAKRPEFSIKRLLFGCCVGSQPMWRKSLHDEFGGFDETLSCASDWDFWLKIVGKYPFKHIPQCLGLYYRNEKGIEHGRKIHSLYERYAVGRRFGNPYISIIPLYKARDNPLVSVWMAVFNGEDYIARAIESVLIQNYRNFELIVVDDGSTDRTADIVRGFKNEPIKYFFKENGGAASARNFGLKKSGGSFIVMLDSDDMMMPGFIARHLAAFEQHPEVDLVYCDDCLINEQDDCIRIINRPEYPDQNAFISDLFRCGFPIVPFRTCIRKSVFDKIGLYDQRLIVGEDYDMIRRFAKQGLKMAHLPAALYLRRLTANGLSRSFNAAKAKSHFEVIRRFTETFTEEQLFPELCWEGLSVEQKQLQVKFRTAVAFIAIGRKYISSGASDYVAEAIDQACAQLGECLKVEPQNRQIGHLWQKCRAIRARQLQSARKLVYQSA